MFVINALVIANISSSVPVPLKALSAHAMNRQLSFVYPLVGSILSMLGDNGWRNLLDMTNGSLQSSHSPVHLEMAHSLSKSYSSFSTLARDFAVINTYLHGARARYAS